MSFDPSRCVVSRTIGWARAVEEGPSKASDFLARWVFVDDFQSLPLAPKCFFEVSKAAANFWLVQQRAPNRWFISTV